MIEAYMEGKRGQLELCSLLKGCDDCPLETLKHTVAPTPPLSVILPSEVSGTHSKLRV